MLSARKVLLWVSIIAFLSSGALAGRRPNVVLIISDDQGWSDHGFMGHKEIKTPNLDKLASQSAVFYNGYVAAPVCRPSLSCMLTGLYTHQHKITSNDPPKSKNMEADREIMRQYLAKVPTFPRMLAKAGYRCLQTGKFWEGHYSNGGFTDGMTLKHRHGGKGLAIGRKTMKPIYDFIDDCGDTPFFIWYAPMMPHNPHNPPERLLKKYAVPGRPIQLAKYWAMCEWFDETCGELLDYLEEKKLSENTLIAYVVDNGWIQDVRITDDSRSTRKGKLSPYDGGLRTPILIRWPKHTKPGKYSDLVSSIDLAPTILTACGLKPPNNMPGFNLLDVVAGKGRVPRKAFFGAVYLHNAVDIHDPASSVTHRVVREGDWKLIHPEKGPASKDKSISFYGPRKPELYNLAKDPLEEHNLATTHPEKVRHLMELLDQWWNPGLGK